MALGNLRSIGAVTVNFSNPSLKWTAKPTSHGIRSCSISGTIGMDKAQQLSELVNNPATQTTIGGFTGVLEFVTMDGDAVGPFQGYYLLESFDINIEHALAVAGRASFSLSAAYLGAVA